MGVGAGVGGVGRGRGGWEVGRGRGGWGYVWVGVGGGRYG